MLIVRSLLFSTVLKRQCLLLVQRPGRPLVSHQVRKVFRVTDVARLLEAKPVAPADNLTQRHRQALSFRAWSHERVCGDVGPQS